MLQIDKFINQYITERRESLFSSDLINHNDELHQQIDGKSVLVIGGAGTIGSSYIKALLHFKPARLFVVDISENGLTELTRDLRSSVSLNVPDVYKTYPLNFAGDIFRKLWQREGPFEIVANFAAHKHVRSEKDHYSIEAMLENNVINTKKLLDLVMQSPPEHFFCVSTDKAANPVNVMGASKKLMEDILLTYAKSMPITTARFANVAFSNGSLLAGFIERMNKRQPLSAPSDVQRYFVSPEESGQICLLASLLGNSSDIFFPRLREDSMKTFSSIAVDYLAELGYKPKYCATEDEARKACAAWHSDDAHYPVYFFPSNTSGEKLYEEFFTDSEQVNFDRFAQLGVIEDSQSKSLSEIDTIIHQLEEILQSQDINKDTIVNLLSNILPDFHHIETGLSLDQKM